MRMRGTPTLGSSAPFTRLRSISANGRPGFGSEDCEREERTGEGTSLPDHGLFFGHAQSMPFPDIMLSERVHTGARVPVVDFIVGPGVDDDVRFGKWRVWIILTQRDQDRDLVRA